MDLSVFDTGHTPRNLNGFGSGTRNLDLDEDIFSDTLLEVSELPEDDYADARDIRDDHDHDQDDPASQEEDEDVTASDGENSKSSVTTKSDGDVPSPLGALIGIQVANAPTTSGSVGISVGSVGTSVDPAGTSVSAKANPGATNLQTKGQVTTPTETVPASLSGEASVLSKRLQVIQANEKHVQGAKTQLAGAAEQKSAQVQSQAKNPNAAQIATSTGREAGTQGSDISRLERALRQVFPASGSEATNTAANTATTVNAPRTGADTLLASRGSEQTLDTTNNLATTSERPTAMATAKAAAARPAFNLPNGRPAEQVSVQVQNAIRNGNDRIQIKLSPASLGNVEVRLELSPDKTVQAIVYADKPETLDMLERDARVLQKALEEAGLRTNSDSLSFERRDSSESANSQADSHGGSGPGREAESGEGMEDNNSHLIETQARRSHDGLIDIEA